MRTNDYPKYYLRKCTSGKWVYKHIVRELLHDQFKIVNESMWTGTYSRFTMFCPTCTITPLCTILKLFYQLNEGKHESNKPTGL